MREDRETYRLQQFDWSPCWYIVWSERGRSKRASTGEADRRKAQFILAAFILERQSGPAAEPARVGVAAALDEYYEQHAKGLPSAEQAEIAVRHLTAYWGAATVDRITELEQDRYFRRRREQGVGDETIAREQSVLRAALNRKVKAQQLASMPFIKSPPRAPARERWLTRMEAAKLLRASSTPHVTLFLRLALYTGARPGAILDLTWDRVDMAGRLITFALPGKRHDLKRRATVRIFGALYTALERAKRHADDGPVIRWAGGPVASVKTAVRLTAERAKIKGVTPGVLRHTAATWMAQNGIDMWKIGKQLGHSRTSTTERYAKHSPEHLEDTAKAMLRGNVRKTRATAQKRAG